MSDELDRAIGKHREARRVYAGLVARRRQGRCVIAGVVTGFAACTGMGVAGCVWFANDGGWAAKAVAVVGFLFAFFAGFGGCVVISVAADENPDPDEITAAKFAAEDAACDLQQAREADVVHVLREFGGTA